MTQTPVRTARTAHLDNHRQPCTQPSSPNSARPCSILMLELPTPGPGEALVQAGDLRRLPHRSACRTGRLAGQAAAAVHSRATRATAPSSHSAPASTDLKVGDKVGNAWLWSACGTCEYCRTGWETLCESQQNGGYSVNGSFGSYMLVNAALCRAHPGRRRPARDRAHPVRRRHRLQGPEGDRHPARPVGGDLRHRRTRAHRRAVRPWRWACAWSPSTSTTPSSPWPQRLGAEVAVNARTSDVVDGGAEGHRRRARRARSPRCTRRRSGRPSA